MNREIKFRGYNYQYKKWFYGSLFIQNYDNDFMLSSSRTMIIDDKGYSVMVDNDTIGQYTGLKDKNGVEIYEGDIVRLIYDNIEHIYQIIFDKEELDFKATNGEKNYGKNFQYLGCCEEIEIIGNIYENEVD